MSASQDAQDGIRIAIDRATMRTALIYYLGIPLATALIFGLNHSGMARYLAIPIAVPYWIGIAVPFWILLDVSSRVTFIVTRPWNPPRWLVLFLGSVASMILIAPYVQAYMPLFEPFLEEGRSYQITTTLPDALQEDWKRLFGFAGVPLYWLGISFIFLRFFGFPKYLVKDGRPAAPAQPDPDARPATGAAPEALPSSAELPGVMPRADFLPRHGYLALIPARLGTTILALQAEDHYVRVHTDVGSALIRYRFADAIKESKHLDGLQVHRSFWIARRAVERVEADGKGFRVHLSNKLAVPVSRSFVGVLKAHSLV